MPPSAGFRARLSARPDRYGGARRGLTAVVLARSSFWFAYVTTRPLGAS